MLIAATLLATAMGDMITSGSHRLHTKTFVGFVTVSLLYTPGSIVLAALQYEMWNGGEAEGAAALGTINMLFSLVLVLVYLQVLRRRRIASE